MNCTPDVLDRLRLCGDQQTDDMLAPLLRTGAVRNFNAVLGALTENNQPIPEDLPADLRRWLAEQGALPAWADRQRLDRAAQFFVAHGPVICLILGTASLVELYACVKGVQALAFTGRLWRNPYRRIGQTVQFLLDVMDPKGLGADGRGIRSIQKVRLMHSAIRNLIGQSGRWDEDDLGTPINQEELLGTLMTFSYTVIRNLKRFDVAVSAQEGEDFLYFWRVVGEMLGVNPEIIPTTMDEAAAVTELIFTRQQGPSREGAEMTRSLLQMYTAHDPTHLFSRMIPSVIRYAVGDQVADWMEIPPAKLGELVLEATGGLPLESLSLIGRRLGNWMLTRGAFLMEGEKIAAFEIPVHLSERMALPKDAAKDSQPHQPSLAQKKEPGLRTIDDVLDRLDGMIETSIRERSPIGYFAALYRGVTLRIQAVTGQGGFDDGERVERLSVTFAGRYFAAYDAYRQGSQTTDSWAVAFAAAASGKPCILQHLMLGMNAHINLDLGIATAQVCPGTSILGIRDDFIRVNQVMGQNTNDMDQTMAKVSPLSRLIYRANGEQENQLVLFNVMMARLTGWSLAEDLALCQPNVRESTIQQRDQQVAAISRGIWHPPLFLLGLTSRIARLTEEHNVRRVIEILLDAAPKPQPVAQSKAG